ncbi:hypothetical protein QIS99_30080 [Streptomyces sp. B-S-A8]|uniref:Uncharacterized protein n=1 Tax=Streptomyces solicavernae TaxID=3043614 RepID=A0ABT6S134_9ACTN|nr:hypothetical protein [Streptomyces sp. B-S-A8]MDI3390409.1 hypothetical protein [Streptomyces sp. B-S-A8]
MASCRFGSSSAFRFFSFSGSAYVVVSGFGTAAFAVLSAWPAFCISLLTVAA